MLRLFVDTTISGSISLPYPGFFSPFPHGTGCTIGDKIYLALPSGLGRFTRGSSCSVLLRCHLQIVYVFLYTGLSPSMAGLSNPVLLTVKFVFPTSPNQTHLSVNLIRRGWWWSYNPNRQACWFGLFRFRSPLLTESLRFLFHWLLRCFSSPGSLYISYFFRYE